MTLPKDFDSIFEVRIWSGAEALVDFGIRRKLAQMTALSLSDELGYRPPIHQDLDEILDLIRVSDKKFLVVFTAGNFLTLSGFFTVLKHELELCSPENFLIAHLLDRKHRWFGFHKQCFVVSIDKLRLMGFPNINSSKALVEIPKTYRSTSNVHDDYTPLWLSCRPVPQAEIVDSNLLVTNVFGAGWLREGLQSGFSATNFSSNLRMRKKYIYPEQRMDNIQRCLVAAGNMDSDEIARDQLTELLDGLRQR